jgi:hypothetical protein
MERTESLVPWVGGMSEVDAVRFDVKPQPDWVVLSEATKVDHQSARIAPCECLHLVKRRTVSVPLLRNKRTCQPDHEWATTSSASTVTLTMRRTPPLVAGIATRPHHWLRDG